MSETIEKVARAIAEAGEEWLSLNRGLQWEAIPNEVFARAAIEAIREPTAEMLEAAVRFPVELVAERNDPKYTRSMEIAILIDRSAARSLYRAMIDTILEETDNG